jgi:ATP-dependent DNA helicase DinG
MAEAVAKAIMNGRHLAAQAGTGTGKSLAYLVPAVLSGKKVVVATATKALQDQLAKKDLPLIEAALAAQGRHFTYAVLKGRSNYLCRQRAEEVGGSGFQQTLDEPPLDHDATGGGADTDSAPADSSTNSETGPARLADQVRQLVAWAADTGTGDRAELEFEPHPRAWAMLSVGPRECPGAFQCPSGGNCFAEAARAAAAAADVVVVNTHLYGSHLASGGVVLPPHDVVIFDEAHEVEEVMTSCLGVELSPGRIRALAAGSRPLLAARRRDGLDTASALDGVTDVAEQLQQLLGDQLGQRVLASPPGAADAELSRLLTLAEQRTRELVSLLRPGTDSGGDADAHVDVGRRNRMLSAGGHLVEDLDRLSRPNTDDVAWVDGSRRAPVLRLSPVDVGPSLAASLWGQVTAVLTSATIPARLTDRLGLESSEVDQLDVGSPFDYRSNSVLYVARHLPDRNKPESEAAIHEELEALINAAGGRTLALFTSRRATEGAAAALREKLTFRILVQDDMPKQRLLREFAEDESSCLFATIGLWQGVDVSGRSLSLVTLDRLPFARPDDPLMQARRDRAGSAAFRTVDLPRAATLLAQGAGRLIRSADDKGVVAVLDPRLATAGYRGVLLAGMPPMRRSTDRRQVVDFLGRILPPPS